MTVVVVVLIVGQAVMLVAVIALAAALKLLAQTDERPSTTKEQTRTIELGADRSTTLTPALVAEYGSSFCVVALSTTCSSCRVIVDEMLSLTDRGAFDPPIHLLVVATDQRAAEDYLLSSGLSDHFAAGVDVQGRLSSTVFGITSSPAAAVVRSSEITDVFNFSSLRGLTMRIAAGPPPVVSNPPGVA